MPHEIVVRFNDGNVQFFSASDNLNWALRQAIEFENCIEVDSVEVNEC